VNASHIAALESIIEISMLDIINIGLGFNFHRSISYCDDVRVSRKN